MSREYPDWVNPWSSAEGRRVYRGTLPLSRMERLADALGTEADGRLEGDAVFRMAFSLDSDRRPVIEITVEAELPLVCQASLEPFTHVVERTSTLGVIEGETEEERLPPGVEPVRTSNGRLALMELVEDELLLGMPSVPRKPGLKAVAFEALAPDAPAPGDNEVGDGLKKPFANLGKLLADKES